MIRPGHHRPLGTTTTMRMVAWDGDAPDVGDELVQVSGAHADDADVVQRAYLVVGFLEGRDERHFRLVCERIAFEDAVRSERRWFAFYNVPRVAPRPQ